MRILSQPFLLHVFALFLFLPISLLLLDGCASAPSSTINPVTLTFSTTSLPSGQVGVAYNSTLVASGGKVPYTWALTSGTLPAGLTFNTSTGSIAGTPTAAAPNLPLTFQVNDSSTPMQTKSQTLTLTISSATLAIATTSLPNGEVGAAYSTTLAATGGTKPYTWTLTSGTLPAGLTLTGATGAITGTPTVSVTSTPLTFQVKDAGSPQQSKTVNLSLTVITVGSITVSLSPKRGGLAITQSISLAATTNDPLGVTWSASAGSFSAQAAATATYVAPNSAGTVTVTATSATDGTTSASATFGVTDFAGVLTYHNDLARDGVNSQEHALTTASVNTATFGKLFACTIDAPAYAQPLWVPSLSIGGGKHNVVFVATSHNTVYAFDADASPCVKYWNVSLINAGETYVSSNDVNSTDIYPDIGIVGTPVIDAATSTLYVVSKSETSGTTCSPADSCFQRLHALSLVDGSEKFGGPANITSAISVPGTGDGSSGGNVAFSTLRQNQRPGLVLLNGVVYVAWASHGDNTPYHGWVVGFDKSTLAIVATFNANPNGSDSGIWMSGGAPASDASGYLYFLTGNGTFDVNTGGSDYGDSTLKLSTSSGLSVADYFTPSNQASLAAGDTDHGSGGAAILVDQPGGPVQHLLIGGGKEGTLFLLNRDNLGQYTTTNSGAIQSVSIGNGIFATAVFWNNALYIAGSGGTLKQFPFNTTSGQFGSVLHSSSHSFNFPGSTPSVSASSSTTNGIVWALDNSAYGTPCCSNGPAVLHAYDATNVGTELWNSTQGTGNAAGNAVKFTVPTVANGKVYVGTRGELSVYGLLPN